MMQELWCSVCDECPLALDASFHSMLCVPERPQVRRSLCQPLFGRRREALDPGSPWPRKELLTVSCDAQSIRLSTPPFHFST